MLWELLLLLLLTVVDRFLLCKKFEALSWQASCGTAGKDAVENSGRLGCELLKARTLPMLLQRWMSNGVMQRSTDQAAGENALLKLRAEVDDPAAKGETVDVTLFAWVVERCGQAGENGLDKVETASAADLGGCAVTCLAASS